MEIAIGVTIYMVWWFLSRVSLEIASQYDLLEVAGFYLERNQGSKPQDVVPIPVLGDIVVLISVLVMLYHLPFAVPRWLFDFFKWTRRTWTGIEV